MTRRCFGFPIRFHYRDGVDVSFPMLPLVTCDDADVRRNNDRSILVSFKVRGFPAAASRAGWQVFRRTKTTDSPSAVSHRS